MNFFVLVDGIDDDWIRPFQMVILFQTEKTLGEVQQEFSNYLNEYKEWLKTGDGDGPNFYGKDINGENSEYYSIYTLGEWTERFSEKMA